MDISRWVDLMDEDLKELSDEDLEVLIYRLLDEAAARGDLFILKVAKMCEDEEKQLIDGEKH